MSGGQLQSGVTLRQDLMTLAEEISFAELGLMGDTILPGLPVSQVSGYYPVLPREARMKIPDTKRAPTGTYRRGQWEWGSSSYACEEFGFEEPIDLVEAIKQQSYINQEEVSAQLALEGLLLARESRIASALLNTTTFNGATNTGSITNEWDDSANATPWADVDAAYKIIRAKCGLGKRLFSLILSDDLVQYALQTTEVKSLVQYTTPVATMPVEQKRTFLAAYLGIKEIIPVSAIFDVAKLANTTSIGLFWSNEYAMLAKLSTGIASFKERSIGRQTVYTPYSNNYIMEEYPNPQANQRIIRAREYRGIIINTDYGYLIQNMKTTVDGTTGV